MTEPTAPITLDLQQDVVLLTRDLCDIETVSGHETPLADAIERSMRALPHLEVSRHGDTVVARTNLDRPERVVIAGHIDTVPLNENLPTRFIEEGGVEYLWGRGTVDMKGGVAVQLKLAAELAEPSVDVTWIWYDHEEVDSLSNGLAKLADSDPGLLAADLAILGEPSRAVIEGGCNGTMVIRLRTTGRRAHTGRAWMGSNAIHAAAPILERLAGFEPDAIEVDGLVYREGLSAVGIAGGVAMNVVPDECVVDVNYRFAPSRSVAEAFGFMREVFGGFDLELVDASAGARPGLDAPLARQFLAAVGGVAEPKFGWTDVARFSALGIPAVNYGPGDGSLAHADDERVPLEQISAVEQGLRAWLTGQAG